MLIAAGLRPAVPRLAGLDRVPYLTSDLLTVNEEGELRELPPRGAPDFEIWRGVVNTFRTFLVARSPVGWADLA